MRTYRKPYRIKRKKSVFKNLSFWLSILILIISGAIFYFFVFFSFFQIKEIKVLGYQKISNEDIKNFIAERIEEKIFFFPTKSIILVNLNEINKGLLEKFPQIAKVNSKRNFPDGLTITIEERLPVGAWCQDYNSPPEKCFLMDIEGIILEPIELSTRATAKGIELMIKSLEQKKEIVLGDNPIGKEDLGSILKIQNKLKEKGIGVKEFVIVSQTQLNGKTVEGWWIYFDPDGDIDWQITELGLVLEKQISPQKKGELQYIDLRFDKIFVFPEEVLE